MTPQTEIIGMGKTGAETGRRRVTMDHGIIRGKRILLVDDEPNVREAFRMMIELDDHVVTEASNGAEALDCFAKDEFDLVVTDFEMPVMKGNELALRIKRLCPLQPILMITAYARELGGSGNPIDEMLNKPVTLTDLRNAISKLLSK